MATYGTVTYSITGMDNMQGDRAAGYSFECMIQNTSGDMPVGATVTSASFFISRIRTYSSTRCRLQLGSFGTTGSFDLHSSGGSETVSATINSSIFSVYQQSIVLTVKGSTMNFREGCYATLTVNYYIATPTVTAGPSTGA